MKILSNINWLISIIFVVCYFYQLVYIPFPWICKKKKSLENITEHNFAVLISARNESAVIGDLIDSLHDQNYNQSLITVFVIADNCTDNTAELARSKGAIVYERENNELIGKGYAMSELMGHIYKDYPNAFDGFFVFDADNVLKKNYIEEMNKTFCQGHDIITSYRNSKNYGDNWISAGYALWFLRESRYLNDARFSLGTSCAVSGTGFFFSKIVADEIKDWPYHTLTEDIEFSLDQITKGRKIAFCKDAEFFDEQPTSFSQAWHQRLRWCKGYVQVYKKYWRQLLSGIFHGSFSCYDMAFTIMPAFFLSNISVILNLILGIWGAISGDNLWIAAISIGEMLRNVCFTLFAFGILTTITEWKHIHTTTFKKIWYCITFPFYMLTYVPISLTSLFVKVKWKHVDHTVSAKNIDLTE